MLGVIVKSQVESLKPSSQTISQHMLTSHATQNLPKMRTRYELFLFVDKTITHTRYEYEQI